MQIELLILLCMAALAAMSVQAADNADKPAAKRGSAEAVASGRPEQRLAETDSNLAFREYERVQMEAFEAKPKLRSLDTVPDLAKAIRQVTVLASDDICSLDTVPDLAKAELEKQMQSLQNRISELGGLADELRKSIMILGAHPPTDLHSDTPPNPTGDLRGGQHAVSPAGDTAVLLEMNSGRTWVLTRSAQGLSVWLPAKRIDSEEQAGEWRERDRHMRQALAEEERQRKTHEGYTAKDARQEAGKKAGTTLIVSAEPNVTKYDKLYKKQLQDELKRLQKELIVAESTTRHADEQMGEAADAYNSAAEDRQPDLVLGMLEAEAKCSKPMDTFERLRRELDAAKQAYVKLLLAE